MGTENRTLSEVLKDPRHLVRECAECRHMEEEGICGLNLHPTEEWTKPEGCIKYNPLEIDANGDPDPEDAMDY